MVINMLNQELPKFNVNPETITEVLLVARNEALKMMAKRLPHLKEDEAIELIIKDALDNPEGNTAKHFNEYITTALKTFF